MNFETITQATDTAVPLNIAKDHLRISDNASDALISGAIQASTGFSENFLNHTLVTKSYRLSLDDWAPRIFLKLPPLIIVDSVKYDDENDNYTKIDGIDSIIFMKNDIRRIYLATSNNKNE